MSKENLFIVIVTGVSNKKTKNASSHAILCNSFDEALTYARNDAELYKHLASTYIERIGDNKCHADIKLRGKYINKTYRISNMAKGDPCGVTSLNGLINTYNTCDYYDGRMLF